jgi:hypothetical protein
MGLGLEDALVTTYPANGDLSTKQFYCVKPITGGKVDLQDSATTTNIGILLNKPAAAGEAAEIAYYGPTKAVAGGTVAVGDRLGSDTNGKVVALTADKARVFAICMQAGVSGDTVEIMYIGESWLGA